MIKAGQKLFIMYSKEIYETTVVDCVEGIIYCTEAVCKKKKLSVLFDNQKLNVYFHLENGTIIETWIEYVGKKLGKANMYSFKLPESEFNFIKVDRREYLRINAKFNVSIKNLNGIIKNSSTLNISAGGLSITNKNFDIKVNQFLSGIIFAENDKIEFDSKVLFVDEDVIKLSFIKVDEGKIINLCKGGGKIE